VLGFPDDRLLRWQQFISRSWAAARVMLQSSMRHFIPARIAVRHPRRPDIGAWFQHPRKAALTMTRHV
jgi:hypothetical protein